jgi:hypothetical protein
VAAAMKGRSGGAFPVRSSACNVNCQRARRRGAARGGRRASFPRPPPIRRRLHVIQRPFRAAFPALPAVLPGLRAAFPVLRASLTPFRAAFPRLRAVRSRGNGMRSPPREARRSLRAPFPRLRVSRRALRAPFPRARKARKGGNATRRRGNAASQTLRAAFPAYRIPLPRGNEIRSPLRDPRNPGNTP